MRPPPTPLSRLAVDSSLATYTTLRGTSLEDSLMGVGRGERNYVLGTRNIFQLKSVKQECEAKFGTRERGNAGTRILVRKKKALKKHAGTWNAKRK